MARVIVVPGLAVHAYAELPVQHLCDNGHDAKLLEPPAWRGVDQDLERYGGKLAANIDHDGAPVDVLIGLSVGTQAAAVAASLTSLVNHLVLVSPAIDPAYRSMIKQASMFLVRGDPHDKAAFFSQIPDWSRAGVRRIFDGFASALTLPLEDVLPRVPAAVTIIHTVVRRHGARAHLDGLDPAPFPHDIATLSRYSRVFDQLPRARQPWSPLPVDEALRGLAAAGLSVPTGL